MHYEHVAEDLDLHSASEEEPGEAAPSDEDSGMEGVQPSSDEIEDQPSISKVPEGSIRQHSVTSNAIRQARRLSVPVAQDQDDSVTG